MCRLLSFFMSPEAAFEKAVSEIAIPALSRFGICLRMTGRRVFHGGSDCVNIALDFDFRSVGVYVGPVGEDGLPLELVLMAIATQLQFIGNWVASPRHIRRELARQIGALVEHCQPFLRGDFSRWGDVELMLRQFAPPDGGDHDAWAAQLRSKLSTEYDRGDYLFVNRACFALSASGRTLSSVEKRLWKDAEKHLAALNRR